MDITGIAFGLFAALLMAGAFLASTAAVRRTPGLSAVGLTANAAVAMALLSAVGIAFLWQRDFNAHLLGWLPTILACIFFWLTAQCLLFVTQRKVDSSQVVPLLGLKLPVLAAISIVAFGESFNFAQCGAICLTVLAAFMLNNAGRKISFWCFCSVILICISYSLSDIFLNKTTLLIHQQSGVSLVKASALNTFITYVTAGIICSLLLIFGRSNRSWQKFRNSAAHGVLWVTSIVFLCVCFARMGTVNGNIVQSTRGLFAILAAPLLVWFGVKGIETKVTWRVTLKRIVAALLMIIAVALYNFK